MENYLQNSESNFFKNYLYNSTPILIYPNFTKPFLIIADAGRFAIAAVLSLDPIDKDA